MLGAVNHRHEDSGVSWSRLIPMPYHDSDFSLFSFRLALVLNISGLALLETRFLTSLRDL